jgi:hypothetical protein
VPVGPERMAIWKSVTRDALADYHRDVRAHTRPAAR